ncbi:hypothetical protein SPRG_03104 [Saprolegnia parasitica CBS 223.65]|uniref:SAM domain-containing protein n=1 Tax=Saprolegnia parasitica (strain CBS 223.65) TaxID=695850 RepID=A0A067CN03_SAPPC|nr:hypothetical protein SPRG_03104 [Saprolegnia parasitica CBS 223.65]KDO31888.1 hypothetical protein SPRG_03104 [Saprolegnia parasitica CBS 223.65]|eukprot:XP_012197087.1 hypothetical protein SPRG_03104 [Saprolegnia parasitica CBS 223.65]
MKTEDGIWGMASLWRQRGPKAVVGIIDTVFLHGQKPGQWFFTCKTGEVLRKKKLSELVERFVRIARANERNVNGHICVARRADGSGVVWDHASFLRALDAPLDPDILALQPFVCSRGSLGAIYRVDMRASSDRARPIFATHKLAQHQMQSDEPVIALDAPLSGVKCHAKPINARLHQITIMLSRHIEEVHGCAVKELTADYLLDDDNQIWLAWIPSVSYVRTARRVGSDHSIDVDEPYDALGRTGQEAVFDQAEDAIDRALTPATHFSLKLATQGEPPRVFPTPFKCSGDFCAYDLASPAPLIADVEVNGLPTSRRNAHALFEPEAVAALGYAKLHELHGNSVRQLANAAPDRLQFTLTYKSIALAKTNKQRLLSATTVPAPVGRQKAYLAPTATTSMRANLSKLYGELDGGTANYYRQVKVCRNCFAVYSLLDAARPLLDALASNNNNNHNNEATSSRDDVEKRGRVTAVSDNHQAPKLPRLSSSSPRTVDAGLRTSASMPQLGKALRKVSPTKPKPWRQSKEETDVTKSFEDFVGLDGYLRGKDRRRKHKPLRENALFPSGLPLKSAPVNNVDSGPSVLLIDTDQDRIQCILDALEAYEVQALCDGALGLKEAQSRHFDVILCHRDAPSMHALEFTKLLRQHEIQHSIALHAPVHRSPIVCITEHTSPEDLRAYMDVGMDGCLSLPLDLSALRHTVDAAIASISKRRRPVKRTTSTVASVHPFPVPSATDARTFAGTFQMDVDTAMPFLILNRPSAATSTLFNLVVVHDIFDTLERLQIFLAPILRRYDAAQVLLWNYPGQASTTWRPGVVLNNVYLASCLQALLRHVGPDVLGEFKSAPFLLLGYGNGVPIALQYCALAPSPQLRALVSVNGFAHVDPTLAAFFHDALKVFACSPATRPDLPVYFHARFLFSGAYLATVSTPLALNLYTAVSNSISLEGRVALCLGALSHIDMREALQKINVPTIFVAGAQDGLVQPKHVETCVASRGGLVDSIHKALVHRRSKACVVWFDAGHEVWQECKPAMATLMEQLITGFHETHDMLLPATTTPSISTSTSKSSAKSSATSMSKPAHVPQSYEDHFINKIMGTMSDVKAAHHVGDASWAAYQEAHAKSAHPKQSTKAASKPSAPLDLTLDPMAPAFERETNRIYKAGDGSRIYPSDRKDVKEYMNWRVQRNATRLTRMDRAARSIQRAYHAYRARTLAHRVAQHKAALRIQRVYRGCKGRVLAAIRRKEDWAVRLVQRAWRGKAGRDIYALRKRQRASAIAIQAVARGFLGRRRVRHLRARRYASACIIQSLFRRLYAIKIAQRRRLQRTSAMAIQRIYRGRLGRKRFAAEKDKYLYSKAQSQNIDFGKQMLLEYKLYGTRLQSEVQLLLNEKGRTEASVDALLKEISEFEEGVHVLETEMHALSKIETEATGVLDEQAKWQLREQKMRLDREFGHMLKKIADRREKLVVLGASLTSLDQARHAKEEDLRGLERKLLLLLEDQQKQLQGIKAKQAKRSQVLVDIAGGVTEPGPLGADGAGPVAGPASTVSPEQRQEANALMESTETMMKFGFMSMSMTYFSSMNMIKAMRHIGAHHTFLESAAAIHQAGATPSILGAPSPFQATAPPGSFPGQQPLLVSAWSVLDVGRWLDTMALGTYKQAFADGTVDGALLYDLNDHDLRYSLGIEHDLHRKKILQAVDRLKAAEGKTKERLYAAADAPLSSLPDASPSATPLASTSATPAATTPAPQGAPLDVDPGVPKLAVQFEELCSMARNGKLKALKEALARWPDAPFDKLSVKSQCDLGVGTVYDDSLARLAFHVNLSDDHGNTLLMLAAQNNGLKVAQFLLSKGANPNHQNKQGQTAGHYAMAYNFFDLGAWLLDPDKGGGRDDLPNMHGLTAYDGLG